MRTEEPSAKSRQLSGVAPPGLGGGAGGEVTGERLRGPRGPSNKSPPAPPLTQRCCHAGAAVQPAARQRRAGSPCSARWVVMTRLAGTCSSASPRWTGRRVNRQRPLPGWVMMSSCVCAGADWHGRLWQAHRQRSWGDWRGWWWLHPRGRTSGGSMPQAASHASSWCAAGSSAAATSMCAARHRLQGATWIPWSPTTACRMQPHAAHACALLAAPPTVAPSCRDCGSCTVVGTPMCACLPQKQVLARFRRSISVPPPERDSGGSNAQMPSSLAQTVVTLPWASQSLQPHCQPGRRRGMVRHGAAAADMDMVPGHMLHHR